MEYCRAVKVNKAQEYLIIKMNCSYRSEEKKVPEDHIQYIIFNNKAEAIKTKEYISIFANMLGDLRQRNKRHKIQDLTNLCGWEARQGDELDRNKLLATFSSWGWLDCGGLLSY